MGRSLLSKILGVVVVATVLVAGTLVALLVPERLEAIDRVQLSKAVSLAKQSSSHLGPAVALDDVELAREVIDGIKADREVTSVSLRHSDGRFLAGAAGQVAPDPIPGRIRVLRRPSELVVVAWVASREGPTGVLELRLDRSESQREKHHTVTATVAAVVMSLVIGVTVAAMVARRVASRATALTSAARDVAGGNLERRIEVSAQDDELGQLERAFVAMLEGLRRARDERERTAATERERLEALVAERTRMLEAQGRELRLILDNVEEALFVIEPGGTLGPECSKKSDEWFGSWREGLTLGGHLGGESARSRAWIDLAWEQVAEGFVPRDLALTQLPQTLERDGRSLQLRYLDLGGEEPSRVLVAVNDVTAELARKRAEAELHDAGWMLRQLGRDPDGAREMFDETQRLIEAIHAERGPSAALKAHLHTVKGSSAIFGLTDLPQRAHAAEEALAQGTAFEPRVEELVSAWGRLRSVFEPLLHGAGLDRVQLARADLAAIGRALEAGRSHEEITAMLRAAQREPASRRLQRLAEQAQALAARAGFGVVTVETRADRVRLDRDGLRPFWSAFAHVLRNAVCHGFEPPEERVRAGKPPSPKLQLGARQSGAYIVIEIGDDGRGIDWQRLGEVAEARGWSPSAHAKKEDVLFASGVSSRDEADEMAGRGEGMGAVKQAVEDLGGVVEVESQRGVGTTFRFRFPGHFCEPTSLERRSVPPAERRSYAPA